MPDNFTGTGMQIGRFTSQNVNQILWVLLIYNAIEKLACNILQIIFSYFISHLTDVSHLFTLLYMVSAIL